MATLTIGRLSLGPPGPVSEPVGDPVGSVGATIVAAQRVPLQMQMDVNTILSGASTLANAKTLRRQLRSLLNNYPLKMQAFLYVIYADDAEQNGWFIPAPTSLSSPDSTAWKAVGLWQTGSTVWNLIGRRNNMREARSVWMKDLRTGLFERDQLQMVLSTDFSALPALQLSMLPHGASSVSNSVTDQTLSPISMPTGRDGGVCQLVSGQVDLAAISYERSESQMTLSDVIVYDRRGQISSPPTTGPGTLWEEVYGVEYPWNWVSGGTSDAPVLDNGLCRVRYDGTTTPGFIVDVWASGAYVEQGKIVFVRTGDTQNFSNTWISAGLVEYTPDRSVVMCVLSSSQDPQSREKIFLTMQRGEIGVQIEGYPALRADGVTRADISICWVPALNTGAADVNTSLFKSDSQTGPPPVAGSVKNLASAGTGAGTGHSGLMASAFVGAANFSASENWVALLRCPTAFATIGSYQVNMSVVQSANAAVQNVASNAGYGVTTNLIDVSSINGAGYCQMQLGFIFTQADQVLEAESMTLGTGTATAVDAAASGTGSNTTTATRTSDANPHVTRANWPNTFLATYRVFARVKTTASTLNIYAKTTGTTGDTVTTTSTTYVWLDLGDIIANNSTFEIHCWATAAATVSVDRIESVMVQDRARTSAIFSGARDCGQASLMDSRMVGMLVAR